MVPRVLPGDKPLGQNLPTFGEGAHKPFTYLYIMIHSSGKLVRIAPQQMPSILP